MVILPCFCILLKSYEALEKLFSWKDKLRSIMLFLKTMNGRMSGIQDLNKLLVNKWAESEVM
jgi:hypothetical protein